LSVVVMVNRHCPPASRVEVDQLLEQWQSCVVNV
jgi:hypothetical protein